MNPLKKRPIAIAACCLIFLLLSLLKPTGFEWPASLIGLIMAVSFWFDCVAWSLRDEAA